jgi:hypothetical protein
MERRQAFRGKTDSGQTAGLPAHKWNRLQRGNSIQAGCECQGLQPIFPRVLLSRDLDFHDDTVWEGCEAISYTLELE